MRIVFFEVEEWERARLEESLPGHELSFISEPLTPENAGAASGAEAVSVFIYSKLSAETLAKLPDLKWVATRSMGYDHVNLTACRKRGVAVSRVPAYGDRTVAEHAFALILALSRKIFLAYERTERGDFDYHGLQGFDLCGKTIGIIGLGKIGANVARIARGFDMEILVHDPMPKPELAAELGAAYVPFEELLGRSDVISLHLPLLPSTAHMINMGNIGRIKRGAILINTARGGLIDTQALLKALEEGILSGAGLDVLEEECAIKEEREIMSKGFPAKCDIGILVRNHTLIARNDVIITPHIAFNSREAVERILDTTAENIRAFAAGKPTNQVS
jgi:D-lactate dehydrogenase